MSREQWLGAELRHFAALAAIAEARSFRAAAERLGYVQSAVSQQIAFLERVAGTRLVERSPGQPTVSLTPAGALLLKRVDSILAQVAAAWADLGRLEAGETGTIRVGVLESVTRRLIPPLLAAYACEWPGVTIVPVEYPTDAAIVDDLRSGALDFGLGYVPVAAGPLSSTEVLRSPIALVVAADTDLADSVEAAELGHIATLPLVAHRHCRLAAEIEDRLRGIAGDVDVVFRSDVTQTVQAMVASGMGVALLPALAVDRDDERIAVVDLDDRMPAARVGLLWHRERELSAAAVGFRDVVRSTCAAVERDLEAVAA